MKPFLFIFLLFSIALLALARGNFQCPMKCEGEKTYEKAGKCPKCAMALAPLKDGESRSFRVQVDLSPAVPVAGQPAKIAVTPFSKLNNTIVKDLEIVHEKPLHFFLVAQDLSWFRHEHPESLADGSYHAEITFPFGGNYVAIADFKPKGEAGQVIYHPIQVSGEPRKPVTLKRSLAWKDGAYAVKLSYPGSLKANQEAALKFRILEKTKVVSGLEPVLGALGHCIALHEDLTEYVHSHPPHELAPSPQGELEFHATFPKPGLYKVWMQFRHQGQSHTSEFAVKVRR